MNLNIETGVKSYDLNGKVTVEFNPSDTTFVKHLYQTFTELEKKQHEYEVESKEIKEDDADGIFAFADKKDSEMKAAIDKFFGKEVCKPLFGSMSVYSFNKDQIPVWMALFLAILDECDAKTTEIGKNSDAINKYIKKYQKYNR